MADENKDQMVEEVKELTAEERAEAWMKWVKNEVNSALDLYLPRAVSGNVNVRYFPHVIELLETGPQHDDSKADGVLLSIVFDFEDPIDLTKPITEGEE